MKNLLLTCVAIAPAVHAQVVQCPQFYPSTAIILAEVPYQHKGKGMVAQQKLAGAGLTLGEFDGGGDLQGLRTDHKGGYRIDFGIPPAGQKWFVCFYGQNYATSWWERLDDKEARCKLNVLKKNSVGMMEATLTCK